MSISCLLVDDHTLFREGLRRVLESESDIRVVGEASDGATCLTSIALTHPDLLVLDLQMPGTDGFYVLDALRDRPGNPRVLVYSSATDEQVVARVRASGADFLAKGAAPEQLAAAVRRLS